MTQAGPIRLEALGEEREVEQGPVERHDDGMLV